ncbi:MAG: LamG-like jellyroll fold domain-containing protein [Hyphomicrobiaceae bacterium]
MWIVRLRLPVLLVTLAATAVPVAIRPLQPVDLGLLGHDPGDLVQNIIGFVPAGIVLAGLGLARGIMLAALLSLVAESSQLVMLYRWPAIADVLMNVLGAATGLVLARRLDISSSIRVTRTVAIATLLAALLVLAGVWSLKSASNLFTGRRPGTVGTGGLEAHWRLDATAGGRAVDSSGHGLDGDLRGTPTALVAPDRAAIAFDGSADYVDFGSPGALRLTSSMTISAWIRSATFPRDDAAIVSSHDGLGFQLDTTIDRGPRTVGFKLASPCGTLMARYGKTPLAPGRWYFVAGVYDAAARTIDVYLDGQRDNGDLLGPVASSQRPAAVAVMIGRRAEAGYGFDGAIGDVRIYSRPLGASGIAALMQGSEPSLTPMPAARTATDLGHAASECAGTPDRDDARFPGAAALLGVLAALAMAAVTRSRGAVSLAGLLAGLAILPVTPSPGAGLLLAGLSLVGAVSVAQSLHQDRDPSAASHT